MAVPVKKKVKVKKKAAAPEKTVTKTQVAETSEAPKSDEPAETREEDKATFESLGVCEELCRAVKLMKWAKPTKIQQEAIPWALQGRDIIGLAETGSGKTGAFALPIVQRLLDDPQRFYAVCLAPTRELCVQIGEQFEAIGSTIKLQTATVVGGLAMVDQAMALAKRPHVVVATPGRLVDHLENTKGFHLKTVKYLVMDEADRLLSMDFDEALDKILEEMLDGRVRSIRMAAEDARGPCWARYLAQLLWEKEELQLQLDSHMRFVPGWDTKARDELKFCSQSSEKPILCSYGAGYSLGTPYWETPKGSSQTSVNCANTFDSDGILLIKARELKAPLDEPRKHYFWGAQFSFSSADVLCEVPYDPQLQMLFFGEEILMAVRFFTHGWDVFTPKEQLFFHLWERDYRRVYWKDNRELFASLLKESQCRVLSQLESGRAVAGTERWPLPGGGVSNPEKDHFSLGTHRTLEDYQVAAGVNFREKRLEARALRGGDNHHREDDFKEAMVLQKPPLTLSDTPAELHSIAGATFSSDALVNARSSYVAQTDTERFVLWYSTTNQTWLLNAGGVAHGLGQEARPVLFSESTHAEPTDVRQWYYFDAYMRRWLPSPSLQFQLKEEEEVEEAESWWNALLKPVPLVELR